MTTFLTLFRRFSKVVREQRFRVQGLHPVTSGICFSVGPSSNPRSRFVNSQLVCLLYFYCRLGFLTCYDYLKYLLHVFQWHACKLAML